MMKVEPILTLLASSQLSDATVLDWAGCANATEASSCVLVVVRTDLPQEIVVAGVNEAGKVVPYTLRVTRRHKLVLT